MEPPQKHGATCAVIAGFPTLLWEALKITGVVRTPTYHVYRQKMLSGETDYWAIVIIPCSFPQGTRTYAYISASTRSESQAIQLAAHKALGYLRHEIPDMAEARAILFLPQYSVYAGRRFYGNANGESDPAIAGLTRYVEALDVLVHKALLEMEMMRIQLDRIKDLIRALEELNQEVQSEEIIAISRANLCHFAEEAGPSRSV